VKFAQKGKFAFKDLARSIVADFEKILVNQLLMRLLLGAVGGAASGSGGGNPNSGVSNAGMSASGSVGLRYGGSLMVGYGDWQRLPQAAHGADWMVGGPGRGVDDTLVALRATRGERILVQTPEQQRTHGEKNLQVHINASASDERDAEWVYSLMESDRGAEIDLHHVQKRPDRYRRTFS